MALLILFLSSVAGMIVSLVALLAFGVTWSQALALYLVASIVPAALVMAGVYIQMLFTRSVHDHEPKARAHSHSLH